MRSNWAVSGALRVVSMTRADRVRSLRAPSDCLLAAGAVDAVTGRVLWVTRDLELPGALPLVVERVYCSAWAHRETPLGRGWSLSLDQSIWEEPGKLVHRDATGREVEHDRAFERGGRIEAPLDPTALRLLERGAYEVVGPGRPVLRFEPVMGTTRLVSIALPSGPVIRLAYDGAGRLASAFDACGRTVSFEHGPTGRLSRIVARSPQREELVVARFEHSPSGDLVAVTDALGATSRFEYEDHLLVRAIDRDGRSRYFGYDERGSGARCIRSWGELGVRDRVLRYQPAKGESVVIDATERKTTIVADAVQNVKALKGIATFEYSGALRLRAGIDRDGRRYEMQHDGRGRPTQLVEPDGACHRFEHDAEGRVTRAVDPLGAETRLRWDASGQLVERALAATGRSAFDYQAGLLRSVRRGEEEEEVVGYDAYQSVAEVRTADRRVRRWQRDWLGRSVVETLPDGRTRRMRRDALGRVVELDEDGAHHRFGYDGEGRLVRAEGAGGEVRYEHDGAGRLRLRADAAGELALGYDAENRLIEARFVSPAHPDRAFRFVRDKLGRVREEHDPDGRRFVYRHAGSSPHVEHLFLPGGAAIHYKRDFRGRPVEVRHEDRLTERFRYDARGALVEARSGTSVVRYERDGAGRVIREVHGELDPRAEGGELRDAVDVRYRYDPLGRRAELRSSLGARVGVLRGPGGAVRAILVGDPDSQRDAWRVDYERDEAGREAGRAVSSGLRVRFERDGAGRPTLRQVSHGSRSLESAPLVWDEEEGTTLRQGDAPAAVDVKRDETGRVVELDGARLTWTAGGLLREVVTAAGATLTFAYDAFGRRLVTRGNDGERRFVWDGDALLHELSSSEPPATWVFAPDVLALVAKRQAGRTFASLTDPMEPLAVLVDDAGEPGFRGRIDDSGRAHPSVEATGYPWRFPGFHEEAGLAWARHRVWSAALGAYLSPNPLGLLGGFDAYAREDDPSGLFSGPRPAPRLDRGAELPRCELLARRTSDLFVSLFVARAAAPPLARCRALAPAALLCAAPPPRMPWLPPDPLDALLSTDASSAPPWTPAHHARF